jgi:hypothetical protein
MIPGRGQSVVCDVWGLLDKIVDGSLQVVESLPIAPFLMPLVFLLIPLDGLQGVDEQGILAASQVLRCNAISSPFGSVEVGSAVSVNEPHCTTAFRLPCF